MPTVQLPEALTIGAVSPLRATLLEAFDSPPPHTVDARAVDDVDGAGIQLLLSAAKELGGRGQILRISPSPVLLETLTRLAVLDRFTIDQVGDA